MKRYFNSRKARFLRFFRPSPVSNIPYYVVRSHVESGFERKYTVIDSFLTIAISLPIGFLLDATLRTWTWWQFLIIGPVVYVLLALIATALNLTADAMTLIDEDQRVQDCVDFVHQQQFSKAVLDDIAALASLNSSATQTRLSLPAMLITAIATIAVIGVGSIGLGFTLGMLALLSLLNFAITTSEANADLIVQKSVLLVSREQSRARKAAEQQLLLQHLMDDRM